MTYASNISAAYSGEFSKYFSRQYMLKFRVEFSPKCVSRNSAKSDRRRKLMRYMDFAVCGPIASRGLY